MPSLRDQRHRGSAVPECRICLDAEAPPGRGGCRVPALRSSVGARIDEPQGSGFMPGKHQSRDHEHLLSVPTYGRQRHTIVHRIASRGIVTVATPLPDDAGWKYLIILPDGRYALGDAPIGNATRRSATRARSSASTRKASDETGRHVQCRVGWPA